MQGRVVKIMLSALSPCARLASVEGMLEFEKQCPPQLRTVSHNLSTWAGEHVISNLCREVNCERLEWGRGVQDNSDERTLSQGPKSASVAPQHHHHIAQLKRKWSRTNTMLEASESGTLRSM